MTSTLVWSEADIFESVVRDEAEYLSRKINEGDHSADYRYHY